MAETLRTAITAFCDNSEKWFSGKDILLFVQQLRGILASHPPEREAAANTVAFAKALDLIIRASEKASNTLREAAADMDEAVARAKAELAAR